MLKYVLMFSALLMSVSAVGLLFFPSGMLSVVGIAGNPLLDFLLRTTGAGVASLVPGVWAARAATDSPLARAVLAGLVVYLFLSSLVDFFAYTQSIVNSVSIPSMALRVLLGAAILWLALKEMRATKA